MLFIPSFWPQQELNIVPTRGVNSFAASPSTQCAAVMWVTLSRIEEPQR
jgi:hypothetical protein